MKKLLAVLFLSAVACSVSATPVNYTEAGDEFEDVGGFSFDGVNSTFTLDIGLNSISGITEFYDSTSDAFGFVIQEGQRLAEATFSVLSLSGYEGNSAGAAIGSDPNIWNADLGSSASVHEGESSSFSVYSWNFLELPLLDGDYIAICCGGGSLGPSDGYEIPVITYRFDFLVEEVPPAVVPVPAAAWLFGSGLLGLIGIGRRKKAA